MFSKLLDRPAGRLPVSTYVGYGAGQIGGQILRDTPSLILPFYMTTVLGLEAALAGLVIIIAKFWVVIADPIAGIVSDRTESRWGRRRPYILVGGLISAITFVLLFFVPPVQGQLPLFVYMTGVYLLLNTAFSMFSVPYLTMATEMSDDPDERTTIMSFRNAALAIGLVVAGSLAPKIVDWVANSFGGSTVSGYQWMGLIVGAIIAFSTLWVFFGTSKAPFKLASAKTVPLIDQLKIAWQNKPFVVLISANIVQYISAGIGYAGGFFFFAYAMGLGNEVFNIISIWIIIIAVASMMAMPALVAMAAKFGKMPVYKWCLIIYSISIQFYWFADAESIWIVWLIAAAIGFFNGGFILMSFSILTDTVSYDRIKTGISREGALSSVYSAVDKIGNALGSAIFLAFLSLIGFIESNDGSLPKQSDTVLFWIAFAYILAPALLHSGSIFILNRYKLKSDDLIEA
ncbi:MAG: MFS transporter [Pseudomonadota bacterium]|nr:MFS transporter [Pseudomonadota bacterium]